jgi:hypothetical protein
MFPPLVERTKVWNILLFRFCAKVGHVQSSRLGFFVLVATCFFLVFGFWEASFGESSRYRKLLEEYVLILLVVGKRWKITASGSLQLDGGVKRTMHVYYY